MTDEQVQRIVDALAGNPWEAPITVAVALASVLLGFGLSQFAERAGRRRAEKQRRVDQRNELVMSILEVTYVIGSYSARRLRESHYTDRVANRVAALQFFGEDGQEVAEWWIKQVAKIGTAPAEDRAFTHQEIADRLAVGHEIVRRMRLWEKGTPFAEVERESAER